MCIHAPESVYCDAYIQTLRIYTYYYIGTYIIICIVYISKKHKRDRYPAGRAQTNERIAWMLYTYACIMYMIIYKYIVVVVVAVASTRVIYIYIILCYIRAPPRYILYAKIAHYWFVPLHISAADKVYKSRN